MNKAIKQLAIIGPTASGKSDLAIKTALKTDAYILSIDSLSIYKEIDIVSAKPSKEELNQVKHFGIDVLNPDDYFSVDIFIDLYRDIKKLCEKDGKNLIIVGGTSFYLKSLLSGLSSIPNIDANVTLKVKKELQNLQECYKLLSDADPEYMQNISQNDAYRIEKALLIYRASSLTPTKWFKQNPPKPIIENLDIYNIDVDRDVLRDRISKRTHKMLNMGLIDEICYLEQKYTRLPHSMGSIGIVEVLEYLDGKTTQEQMCELISTHTAQLAKRQQTFNRTQFENISSAKLEDLERILT
ncbi:tRNA delta(2)-isopentenylpyrophosphate transferase [Sulfurimonas gotlandica GD1]|uniref:tRNA dimethylallyltransferase n=1 Tax=Sulfurimonas gotlandica (strain DSM 19862 / JCM 16533 / GD1) TaxID=929558 RepID=B6BI70_SULGG|nr:tRNA (adenosine(37)-N6)-dimethylallyltransferase MiaA [Sulfurimonas gotlandica]EDZ63421.1 tRNA delta(2)-isopentenylpyrophosphate transferase [Sulfurimonas gotlandica GD1]EHP30222.1 tRNA delta(2)-isopentenylpyrophosphate transferase [Sulfurimonas gotlandica GD1]